MSEYDNQLLRTFGISSMKLDFTCPKCGGVGIAGYFQICPRCGTNLNVYSRELKRIDASRVTLAIQDPHLGTVRSMQHSGFSIAGRGERCEFIDDIDAPETVIMDCVAIDESIRRRGVKR